MPFRDARVAFCSVAVELGAIFMKHRIATHRILLQVAQKIAFRERFKNGSKSRIRMCRAISRAIDNFGDFHFASRLFREPNKDAHA